MLLVGVLTVASVSLALTLNALRRAPEGYEDETGFHVIPARPRYSGASVLPRRATGPATVGGTLHVPLPAGAAGHLKV